MLRTGAPEGIRTPGLLIRSQMLYPLSYRRTAPKDLPRLPDPGDVHEIAAGPPGASETRQWPRGSRGHWRLAEAEGFEPSMGL